MSHAVTPISFPQRLKDETSTLHQELENLSVSKAILKDEVTTKEYLKYLDLMHDVVKEVETIIFPALSNEIPDLNQRFKAPLVEQDFLYLGYEKDHIAPVFADLPKEISTAFALGVLYVIEGSSLGGRVIYKHIHSKLGYGHNSGAAFFAGYGDQTGFFWKNFMTTLVAFEKNHNHSEDIIAGANYTFQAIKNHFEERTEL